eukprot:TRINITY_DN76591_c0_g1_i1.p1 TRINITY_DN76591_c0_g1~~TRINITY_DN76591_c0_g1_i1.p1  ORF type:complete len:123 (+),score=2.39 TRINITY_DN76591_c0_g1_i1:71-439(+)
MDCKGGCGFFGNESLKGYCSVCHKKEFGEAEPQKIVPVKVETPETKVPETSSKKGIQKNKKRCFQCRKKVGLTGTECQCGYIFCAAHRYPDEHECDFDFVAHHRSILEKRNTRCVGQKLDRL